MVANNTEKSHQKSQLNVWVDKETRRDLNRVMQHETVATQADAISLALRIAVKYLQQKKEIDD